MPSLLLLEADRLTAAILSDGLSALGWDVRVEPDGLEALRLILADPPDALLADLVLPGMDGLSVCAQVRLQLHGANLPVVVTSAREDVRAQATAAGADSFLTKPASAEQAHAMLTRLLKRRPAPAAAFSIPPLRTGATNESGTIHAGWLPELLRRLWRERFTGALDITAVGGLAVRVYLQQGYPGAARSSDRSTDFGVVLAGLGLAAAEQVNAAVASGEGERPRTVGEVLVHGGVLDRLAVERTLREQVLLRVLGAGKALAGSWRTTRAESLGFAGFEVHPVAIEWRLGGVSVALPGTGFRAARVTAPTFTPELWESLDPQRTLRRVRAMLSNGAQMSELLAEGAAAERLLGLLYTYGLLRLAVDQAALTDEDPRQDALAAIAAEHRLLADASHYAVLGLGPTALEEDVAAAESRALGLIATAARTNLDAASRDRLRDIQMRVKEAGRVLGDSARRAVYDARLDGVHLRSQARTYSPDTTETTSPEELAEYGRHLLSSGRALVALPVLNAALMAAPDDDPEVMALLGHARGLVCPEDPLAGEDMLRQALRVDGLCELALLMLAEHLARRPDGREESQQLYRTAFQANPDCALAGAALRALAAASKPDT